MGLGPAVFGILAGDHEAYVRVGGQDGHGLGVGADIALYDPRPRRVQRVGDRRESRQHALQASLRLFGQIGQGQPGLLGGVGHQ